MAARLVASALLLLLGLLLGLLLLPSPPSPSPLCKLSPAAVDPAATHGTRIHVVANRVDRYNVNHYFKEQFLPSVELVVSCGSRRGEACEALVQSYGLPLAPPASPTFGTHASALMAAFLSWHCAPLNLSYRLLQHAGGTLQTYPLAPRFDFNASCAPRTDEAVAGTGRGTGVRESAGADECFDLHFEELPRASREACFVPARRRRTLLNALSLHLRLLLPAPALTPAPLPLLLVYSREDSRNGRRLRNAAAVVASLQSALMGQARVQLVRDLAGLTLLARAQLFSSARVVLAPHGAWIVNSLFMPAGALVVAIERQPPALLATRDEFYEAWDAHYARTQLRVLLLSSSALVRGRHVLHCAVTHHPQRSQGDPKSQDVSVTRLAELVLEVRRTLAAS